MTNATVKLKVSRAVQDLLRCPACRATLLPRAAELECSNGTCARVFPVVDGVPLLINEQSSVFSIPEVIARHRKPARIGPLRKLARRVVPLLSLNVSAGANYRKFEGLLPPGARVLVVGSGSKLGHGIGELGPALQIVKIDLLPGVVDIV
jgi:uncharacterized protein YbaR (Trm112 family)